MSLAERQERDLACPIEFMRLTLTYDGPLPAANGKNPRRAEKNDIRRYIQPQIKEALQAHPALDNGERFKLWTDLEPSEQYSDHPNRFFVAYKIGSYGFLPLITRKHHMVCELDILFLRREQPGALVHDGDLDNRLKVLFDGLRMPLHNDELEGLRDEPDLFCCLLADDSLITAGECANGTVVSAAGARYESVESSTCDRRSHSCDPCHLREYRTWRLVTMPSTDAAWIDAI